MTTVGYLITREQTYYRMQHCVGTVHCHESFPNEDNDDGENVYVRLSPQQHIA